MEELFTVMSKEEALNETSIRKTRVNLLIDQIEAVGAEAVEVNWSTIGYNSATSCVSSICKTATKRNWITHRAGDRVYLIKKEKPNGIET